MNRKCIVCGSRALKRDLLRLSFTNDKIVIDLYQINQARGFYIHPNKKCLQSVNLRKKLNDQLGKLKFSKDLSDTFLKEKLSSDSLDNFITVGGRNIKNSNRISFSSVSILEFGFLGNNKVDTDEVETLLGVKNNLLKNGKLIQSPRRRIF